MCYTLNMSIEAKILSFLFEPKFRYKGTQVSFVGLPDFGIYKRQSVYNSFSKIKKMGYVKISQGKVFLTTKGIKCVKNKDRDNILRNFTSDLLKDKPKDLIIMYDIPNEYKVYREWLRFHLKKFGYEMVQKSVWVGPSPLPKEFKKYINTLDLNGKIKVLKLAKPYTEKSFLFK